MAETPNKREKKRFPLYVVRRMGLKKRWYWLIRAGGILLAFLMAGITCTILAPGSFGTFYSELFVSCFDFNDITVFIDLLAKFNVLLLIAILLTPAFKMRFWNIGAEGQILVGCLAAAGVAKFSPPNLPNALILIFALLAAMLASTIWAVVPAIFKAFFNTNETLFTLMMNYIAMFLGSVMISVWIKSGSQVFGMLSQGYFPRILNSTSTLVILIGILVYVFMYFYLEKSKWGYEVGVLGESVRTAEYAGINVKKVTIRTMIISGLLFGVVGFMIVCGIHRTFNTSIVGGNGFTGVLVAWLGHFNPFEIALYAFLFAFMEQGTTMAASGLKTAGGAIISASQFSAICMGVFFFIIIACEFFSNYQIKIHPRTKGAKIHG